MGRTILGHSLQTSRVTLNTLSSYSSVPDCNILMTYLIQNLLRNCVLHRIPWYKLVIYSDCQQIDMG